MWRIKFQIHSFQFYLNGRNHMSNMSRPGKKKVAHRPLNHARPPSNPRQEKVMTSSVEVNSCTNATTTLHYTRDQPNPSIQRVVKQELRGVESFGRFDLDILCTMYNVQSLIKKTPPLPLEADLETALSFIARHVANIKHFEYMLIDAQGARNKERAKGIHWFERTYIPENYDIYSWRKLDYSSE